MVLPERTRQLLEPLKHQISQSMEPIVYPDDDHEEDDDCITSCVGAKIKPRPTLNRGAVALPLPE